MNQKVNSFHQESGPSHSLTSHLQALGSLKRIPTALQTQLAAFSYGNLSYSIDHFPSLEHKENHVE